MATFDDRNTNTMTHCVVAMHWCASHDVINDQRTLLWWGSPKRMKLSRRRRCHQWFTGNVFHFDDCVFFSVFVSLVFLFDRNRTWHSRSCENETKTKQMRRLILSQKKVINQFGSMWLRFIGNDLLDDFNLEMIFFIRFVFISFRQRLNRIWIQSHFTAIIWRSELAFDFSISSGTQIRFKHCNAIRNESR